MKPWRVRTLMVIILLLAIDLGAYHTMMTDGSTWAVVAFLLMNLMVPVVTGLFLSIRRISRDHTSTTLY
ncbi:hypothetical protein SAMN05444166_2005 [Singulisphaera sp. GP187]|nr:hypothetical protein SAMN05444166_2005 [Singulisphaera sp. GP187]